MKNSSAERGRAWFSISLLVVAMAVRCKCIEDSLWLPFTSSRLGVMHFDEQMMFLFSLGNF